MKTEVIVVENERDLRAARLLVAALSASRKPSDVARAARPGAPSSGL